MLLLIYTLNKSLQHELSLRLLLSSVLFIWLWCSAMEILLSFLAGSHLTTLNKLFHPTVKFKLTVANELVSSMLAVYPWHRPHR
jgi:hypothetical protein